MLKVGANFLDQNKIRRLAADGVSVDDISVMLRIEKACVKKFMPAKPKKAPAPPVE